jgi:neutral trehalase
MNLEFKKLKERTQKGFNTYFNNNLLTHVLMPQGIAISLGMKYFNTGRVLKEALIGRENVRPGPRSYDGSYTELEISCDEHVTLFQTAAVDGEQYILVTPIKNTGYTPPVLLISAAILWNRPGYAALDGERLLAVTPDKTLEVFTDGKRVRQLNTGLTNPYVAVELSQPVAVSTVKDISAEKAQLIMETQKNKVLAENAKYGELSEAYNAMRTCLAWDTIFEPEKEQVCSPVSRLWSIGGGGYILFDWDTYFSSMLAMPENKDLAYTNVIAITHEKTEDGFIPNFGSADNYKSRDRSQPPVGSLALKEIYKIYKEKWIVEYLFDDLLTWNRWFSKNRARENGQLSWGSNPYESKNGRYWELHHTNCSEGGSLESGLDNSQMFDDVPFDSERHIQEQSDVGLTGLYIMDCETLAELADDIGRVEEAKELRARAELSKAGLEEMWDEEFGLYLNKRTDTGKLSRRISPTNFYALFSDKVSPERARRMLNEHFFNPEEFFGEYIIPMTPRNDPAYKDQNYWRGRIWAPVNYLVYIALRRYSAAPCAANALDDVNKTLKSLEEKSVNLLMKEWTLHGHVHENYGGDTGLGCDVKNSDKFYHWGALLALIGLTGAGYIEGSEKPLRKE